MSVIYGSIDVHRLSVEPCHSRERRRVCPCGCSGRITHIMCANGICMYMGCEFSAWRRMRDAQKARGFR